MRGAGHIRMPRKFTSLTYSRFATSRRAALIEHLGRQPSTTERLLIEQTITLEWQQRLLNRRLHDDMPVAELRALLRTAPSLVTEIRMNLQALGLRPPAPVDKPLVERFYAD